MNERFHEALHYVFSIVPALGGFVIWFLFVFLYSDIDAVSIYTLNRHFPVVNEAFIDNSAQTLTQKILNAQINMIDECVFPDVYNIITTTKDSTPTEILKSNGITDVESAAFQSKWSLINFDSWNKASSAISLPYTDIDQASSVSHAPARFTPICRCMHAVFKKYRNSPSVRFEDAKAALLACLATRHHIPKQTVLWGSGPNDKSVSNRKCLSRSAYLLIMGLAVIGNLLYRRMDFNRNSTTEFICQNIGCVIGICVVILLIWFLPAANPSLNQGNLMSIHSLTIVPGLVILAGVEWVWSHTDSDIRRQVYSHPFFFFLILTSLYAIALVENGVFTLDVLMSYYWLSVTTSCVYATVIFCAIHRVWEHESSRSGYFLLLFCSCIGVAIRIIPTFPINCSLNILWLLPVFYAGIHFFGIILSEQISGQKRPDDKGFTRSAYYISMGQFLIALIVIFYFTGKLQFLSMGDSSLHNANIVPKKPNFELFSKGGRFYGP